jgi:hypothetical protein
MTLPPLPQQALAWRKVTMTGQPHGKENLLKRVIGTAWVMQS